MSVEKPTEDWVKAATGFQVDGKWFDVERVLTSRHDLSEQSPFRSWHVSIELVEGKDDEEVARHDLAWARAIEFTYPLDDDWAEIRDEADALDADVHTVVETLAAGEADEALADVVTMRALYIDSLDVAEPVRGHRWGCTAVANLLDGLDRSEAVVVALEPVGRPEYPFVARIAMEFGAEPLPGTSMRWQHTAFADFDAAVQKWVMGPYQFD